MGMMILFLWGQSEAGTVSYVNLVGEKPAKRDPFQLPKEITHVIYVAMFQITSDGRTEMIWNKVLDSDQGKFVELVTDNGIEFGTWEDRSGFWLAIRVPKGSRM